MSELQALVLCGGGGSRMPELTDYVPKCLLPVAGLPMFWYPVNTLVRAGITEIQLIFREALESEVRRLLDSPMFSFTGVSIEPIFMSRDFDDAGTAEVVRHYASKITKDVLIVSGDFITDASLLPMIDQFRAYKASFTCFLSEHAVTGPYPGPKVKRAKGRDLIAYVEKTNQVVFMASEEDFDTPVNAELWVEKFPNVSLTARLNDCHVYLFRQKTILLLQKLKKMASLKADFVPYLLEQQCNTGTEQPEVKCLAYVHAHENGTVTAHANTTASYFEVNKAIVKSLCRVSARISTGQLFDFRATGISSADSRVDDTAQVTTGRVIKRSSIGADCRLAEKCRVQNSLLLDGVRIGKGASVSQCILCPGVVVEDGAELTNCVVATGQRVAANAKVQNELIEADDDNDEWTTDA